MQNSLAPVAAVCLAARDQLGDVEPDRAHRRGELPRLRAEVAVLGAAAGLERHDALDLDARARYFIRTSWASASRSWSRSSPVRSTSTICVVRQRHPALEHLLARDVEDVGPGHLCRHVPDCCVCRVRAPRAGSDRRSAVPPPSLDCAHGEHLDTDAAPGRRAAVRTGQRLPDPPRAGLLAGRRVGPHQPGLDLLRARDPRARRAPGAGTRSSRATAAVTVYTTTVEGRAEFQRLFAEAVRVHDRGSARGFTTALSLAPLVSREVFLGLLQRAARRRSTPCSPRGRRWPPAPADVLPPHLPPLIALWNAQGRTERAWLVEHDRRRSSPATGGTPASTAGWAPPAGRPGLGHAGRPRALPPGPRPDRLTESPPALARGTRAGPSAGVLRGWWCDPTMGFRARRAGGGRAAAEPHEVEADRARSPGTAWHPARSTRLIN